jgi:RsiW-degrading membrane proteinase PrsW (M82 family)
MMHTTAYFSSDAPKNTPKFVIVITVVITGFVLLLLSLAFVVWRKVRRSKRGQFCLFLEVFYDTQYHHLLFLII